MTEIIAAIAGGALVGLFALMMTLLQQRHETRQSMADYELQRKLAAEEHAREVTMTENKNLSRRLSEQLSWGDRICKAVWRVTSQMDGVEDKSERFQVLSQAANMFGINFNESFEASRLLPPEFFEDGHLRGLVAQHLEKISKLEIVFIFADGHPENLPNDPESEYQKVNDLKLQIEMRRRDVLRTGNPL